MTAVLLTTLFLGTDGFQVIPLVIIAVAVSFVLTERLIPPPVQPVHLDHEDSAASQDHLQST
jgi:hypothetical protein